MYDFDKILNILFWTKIDTNNLETYTNWTDYPRYVFITECALWKCTVYVVIVSIDGSRIFSFRLVRIFLKFRIFCIFTFFAIILFVLIILFIILQYPRKYRLLRFRLKTNSYRELPLFVLFRSFPSFLYVKLDVLQ